MINPASIIEGRKNEESHSHGRLRQFLDHPMLVGLLDIEQRRSAGALLESFLFEPIRDLRDRPSKEIRGQLVRLGGRMATRSSTTHIEKNLKLAEEVVEMLHAGSLIVDDIEDGSATRRGRPAIHHSYGVPVALNAANWSYFWPLNVIGNMDIPAEKELELYRNYHRTLLRAHFGQAIDVGLDIQSVAQSKVKELCLLSMELKTGALTAFALGMGAMLAGLPSKALADLDAFGHGFGVALQMFDDLGNLKAVNDPRQFEDLHLRRPSWVWAMAADQTPREYEQFVQAVQMLPDRSSLEQWLKKLNFHVCATREAHDYVVQTCRRLETSLPLQAEQHAALRELQCLGFSVERAYG